VKVDVVQLFDGLSKAKHLKAQLFMLVLKSAIESQNFVKNFVIEAAVAMLVLLRFATAARS